MQRRITRSLAFSLAVMFAFSIVSADDKSEPEHTVKEVMKQAHKGGLLKTVLGDNSTADDQKKLLNLYISLWENKPPKGDVNGWKQRTGDVVAAAAKVVVGREGAKAELRMTTKCAGCHGPHKPSS